jgi:hypothetical protein
MNISKIKEVKNGFDELSGPSQIVTLGIKVDEKSFLLGTFYYGSGMPDYKNMDQDIEHLIDKIVLWSKMEKYGVGPEDMIDDITYPGSVE